MLLIHIGYLHRVAHVYGAGVGSVKSHNEPEERSLTCTIRAYHTHDACRWEHEIEILEKELVAIRLANIMKLDDLVTQVRSVRDIYFQIIFLFLDVGRSELLISAQTGFLLGLTSLRGHPNPFKLSFKGLSALAFLFFFHSQALALLVEPARIVTLPRNAFASVQFQNPSCHIVEEVSVVGHGDYRTLILLQVCFKPLDTLGIEVVRRLVEQEHVRFTKKQSAQSHSATFASRQVFNQRIRWRTLKGIHGPFELGFYLPALAMLYLFRQFSLPFYQFCHLFVRERLAEFHTYLIILFEHIDHFLHAFLNHFDDRLFRIHLRFLLEIAY